MKTTKCRLTVKLYFSLVIAVFVGVLSLMLTRDAFCSLTREQVEEARRIIEQIGRIAVDSNDLLKLADTLDPVTNLPYAYEIGFLAMASKAERYLQNKDYGSLLYETAWFTGREVLRKYYPLAAPWVVLGQLYADVFFKLANVPAFFKEQFVQSQIDEYFSRRRAGESPHKIRTDPANSDLEGFLMPGDQKSGTLVLSLKQAQALKAKGVTPEDWFKFLDNLWTLEQQRESFTTDGSIKDLVQRIEEETKSPRIEQRVTKKAKNQSASKSLRTSDIAEYAMLSKTGAKWVYNFEREVTVTRKFLGRQWKKPKQVKGTLTITNQGTRSFEGKNAILFVWKYDQPGASYSFNYYLIASPKGITLVGEEFQSSKAFVKTTYNPPKLYGKNPLKIGATWSYTGVAVSSGYKTASTSFTETRSILGSENVAVPAGSFEAIKLVWLQPQGTTTTEWWVNGVGMIKTVQPSSNFVAELVSYSIPTEEPKIARADIPSKNPRVEKVARAEIPSKPPMVASETQQKKVSLAETPADGAKIRLKDGSVIIGKIESGTIGVKTSVGKINVTASDILSFKKDEIKLKDGSVFKGRILGGQVDVRTKHGTLSLEGVNLTEITSSTSQVAHEPTQQPKKSTQPKAIFDLNRDTAAVLLNWHLDSIFRISCSPIFNPQLFKKPEFMAIKDIEICKASVMITGLRKISQTEVTIQYKIVMTAKTASIKKWFNAMKRLEERLLTLQGGFEKGSVYDHWYFTDPADGQKFAQSCGMAGTFYKQCPPNIKESDAWKQLQSLKNLKQISNLLNKGRHESASFKGSSQKFDDGWRLASLGF